MELEFVGTWRASDPFLQLGLLGPTKFEGQPVVLWGRRTEPCRLSIEAHLINLVKHLRFLQECIPNKALLPRRINPAIDSWNCSLSFPRSQRPAIQNPDLLQIAENHGPLEADVAELPHPKGYHEGLRIEGY